MDFAQIPSNLRVPLFWVELDPSAAGSGSGDNPKSLLFGQMLSSGSAAANTPVLVSSAAQAKAYFGTGSMLAQMAELYLRNDPFGELWCCPVADASGTNATAEITVTDDAAGDGTIYLYIGARLITVGVATGDTAEEIATALAAAIEADPDCGCDAAVDGVNADRVDVTYMHDGLLGNHITLRTNYLGISGGQSYPDGVTLTVAAADLATTTAKLASGATDPTLTTALASIDGTEYDFIGFPWNDATNLAAIGAIMDDRWGPLQQLYGHVWSAMRNTQGSLTTAGNALNDPALTMFGYDTLLDPPWKVAAAAMGGAAKALKAHCARPLQTVALEGILPLPAGVDFTATESNTLLYDGIGTLYQGGGKVRIQRAITTYQTNAFDVADDAYLDANTRYQLMEIIRRLKAVITTKYPRHILVSDGTRIGEGQSAVSPSTMRAELVAGYADLVDGMIAENAAAFAEHLVVERNADDPNRLDVLYTPDLANQLRVFAAKVPFRLQYPTTEA